MRVEWWRNHLHGIRNTINRKSPTPFSQSALLASLSFSLHKMWVCGVTQGTQEKGPTSPESCQDCNCVHRCDFKWNQTPFPMLISNLNWGRILRKWEWYSNLKNLHLLSKSAASCGLWHPHLLPPHTVSSFYPLPVVIRLDYRRIIGNTRFDVYNHMCFLLLQKPSSTR